jgi:hypothetical protein
MKDSHPNDRTDWVVQRKLFLFTFEKSFDTESQARKWMRDSDILLKVLRV